MKKITSSEDLKLVGKGDILYYVSEKETIDFCVMAINDKGILLIHQDGMTLAKLYPLGLIIDTNWYLTF